MANINYLGEFYSYNNFDEILMKQITTNEIRRVAVHTLANGQHIVTQLNLAT